MAGFAGFGSLAELRLDRRLIPTFSDFGQFRSSK
jgi:hypothetical protein